jgi:AraC-like DNA-binding protein
MTTTAAPGFSGNLYLWPGRGLYIGRTADTDPHAHHALQVCIGIDGDVEVERSDGTLQEIVRSRSIVVEPDRRHRLRATTQPVVLVYLDPEAIHARAILSRGGAHIEFDVASVLAPGSSVVGGEALAPGEASALCDRVVTALSGLTPQARAIDGRIERAIATMRGSLETMPPLGELAAAAGLSAGRLGHLFREVTGIPMRRYQLWLRLVAALAKLTSGCSLTEAAHAAGFADSAHMTRTFRRMFGIAPSVLHRHSRFVQAHG